ncbi:MAG: Rv2175c family DNA-binding protein [Mycobacterium sp.]|nr:Rv2175c family DNA-binding protein [Mycobacterium sp.]
MSSIPAGVDVLDPEEPVYDLPTVAELLGIPVTKVHQQLRDGQLVAVRRNGIPVIPQVFFTVPESGRTHVVKTLSGLLAVMRDGGYQDPEILRWMFTPDPTLTVTRDGLRDSTPNARPVDALHTHQAREVLRRAQAMAY